MIIRRAYFDGFQKCCCVFHRRIFSFPFCSFVFDMLNGLRINLLHNY